MRLVEFLDIQHVKVVRLSAVCSGCFPPPQEMFLVLIYGRVDKHIICLGLVQWM